MPMYKRCPNCQTLNSEVKVVCIKTQCGADLTYAGEVYANSPNEPLPEPDPPTEPTVTTGLGSTAAQREEMCACVGSPEENSSRPGHCFRCNGRLPGVRGATMQPNATASGERPAPHPVVVCVRLQWPGGIHCLVGTGLLIGRDVCGGPPDLLAMMQAQPTLSRVHAWLGCDGSRLEVIDLGSHNGTSVGTHRLVPGQPHALQLGIPSGSPVLVEFGPSIRAHLSWESMT